MNDNRDHSFRATPEPLLKDEGCLGSSMVDEIITLPFAWLFLILTVMIGISAFQNMKDNKKQNTTLKYLLYTSTISAFLELLGHIIIYTVCIATDSFAVTSYIVWIPSMCYSLLLMCILATLIVTFPSLSFSAFTQQTPIHLLPYRSDSTSPSRALRTNCLLESGPS